MVLVCAPVDDLLHAPGNAERLGMVGRKQSHKEKWLALEANTREAFAEWADYRLGVFTETSSLDGRVERISALREAADRAEALAVAWSAALDPATSIFRAQYLAGVLRTGEGWESYVARVSDLMRGEVGLFPSIQSMYEATYQTSRQRPLIFRRYERHLPDFDIPANIDLMVESALYGLYVAASPSSKVVVPDNRRELWRALSVDDEALRIVTPRRFEELVAFVYEQLGCRALVTGATRDGGADVLAWQPGPFGTESLVAVQVKLYSKERKVGLAGVHALHGAVTHYNAAHGHLVTTSDVAGPAQSFLTERGYHFIDFGTLLREIQAFID